jgi:transposase
MNPGYLLRTGCQWRLLPHQFPPWGTVYHYFRSWEDSGTWVQLHRAFYEQARIAAGRATCPSVVIMDGQSVKTTERDGTRGFDGYKRVKGRKRHILVDTLGLMVANRVEPANLSDRGVGSFQTKNSAKTYVPSSSYLAGTFAAKIDHCAGFRRVGSALRHRRLLRKYGVLNPSDWQFTLNHVDENAVQSRI